MSTGPGGTFEIDRLRPGDYRVFFWDFVGDEPVALSEYYDDELDASRATLVQVAGGHTTDGVDAALDRPLSEWTGAIAGRLVGPDGTPASGTVTASRVGSSGDPNTVGVVSTDPQGAYSVLGLREGAYRVRFEALAAQRDELVGEYFRGATGATDAELVTVGARQTTADVDGALHRAGSIAGRVVDAGGAPVAALVQVFHATSGALTATRDTLTGSDGAFLVRGLQAGQYRVAFAPHLSSGLDVQWYRGKPEGPAADLVTVATGTTTTGIDAVLRPAPEPPQPEVCPRRP